METTKPFLFLDLQKSWREELHPRDEYGKFTSVKGGSRIVTKTGKTGVVHKVTDTHYHATADDGTKFKTTKGNALHYKDHEKATKEAKKRKAKTKKATDKAKATKTTNKANGTGKAKVVIDPTKAKAPKKTNVVEPKVAKPVKTASTKTVATPKPKTAKQVERAREKNAKAKASESRKKNLQSKKQRDMEAPVLKRQVRHDQEKIQEVKGTIPQLNAGGLNPDGDKRNEQNRALDEINNFENIQSISGVKLVDQWQDAPIQKLLEQPPNKRSADQINAIAGKLTTDNDKLARYVTNKFADSRGIQYSANIIGNKATRPENVIRQDTGLYGDMLQSARASMFETLTAVLSGSQNPGTGTAITAHVMTRMRNKMHRDLYGILNEIPAAHEIRGALGDKHKAEMSLSQKLGRTPSADELAEHLQKTSKHFREAPIAPLPKWDEKEGRWIAEKKRIADPKERLEVLQLYGAQQRTVSGDKNVGADSEREVSLMDGMTSRTDLSLEEQYEAKERQKELSEAIPQAMEDMGLSDDEIQVMSVMFSQASEAQNRPNLTAEETAERLRAMGMEHATNKWVANRQAAANRKIQRAIAEKHPAIQQLMTFMKSFVFSLILKSIYRYDLVKSLQSWGVDHTVLEESYTRTICAPNRVELQKSLAPYEHVGSYVRLDSGDIVARVVEFTLPEQNELYKSFNMFMSDLQKSLFPHKGGSNHAINQKASEHIRKNAGKYKALAASQLKSAKAKSGGLTWSQQLLIDNPGTCWITWGGKKILIHGESGEIAYDSHNATHREERHGGSQVEKTDYHHEKEALDEHETNREKQLHDDWKRHIQEKEAKASKSKKGETVDYDKEREAFAKKHGVEFDEDGNLKYTKASEVGEHNAHIIDHGISAFREQSEEMSKMWKDLKDTEKDRVEHKYTEHYADMSDEEREAYDKMSRDERMLHTGKHVLDMPGVRERLQKFHEDFNMAGSTAEKMEIAEQAFNDLNEIGKEHGSKALKGTASMLGKDFKKGSLAGILGHVAKRNPANEGNEEDLIQRLGSSEMALSRNEVTKNHIPEGRYMLGNPLTGKTLIVEIGSGFEGGRAGKGGKFAPALKEAFDPDGREHEENLNSWGQLGKVLGYTGNDATKLKENLVSKANTDPTTPFLKPISDEEYMKHRASTKLGLQETMLHKEFKLVDQERDKNDRIIRQTFAQKMPDGTINQITVDGDGIIVDPLMRRLLNQRGEKITNEQEMNDMLKRGVGSRAWITAHFGSDIHVGDALGHHVQLEYDGKGAPVVRGGKYDGYRYIDSRDVPKGAIDPATGEPVKALFKNGKLVDRRFTTTNEVPMKAGNAVMYPNGQGGWRKGRIHSVEDGNFKVTDGKGHVIGMFKASELKNATEEGRILSNSGNASVALTQVGTHRMNVGEAFEGASTKAKSLFEEALRKARIKTHAFDDEGDLKNDIELSDADMRKLQKVMGRSKAAKEMLSKFNSNYRDELELHVPESLREVVTHTGVNVSKDGKALISAGKFEELRDALNQGNQGLSISSKAQDHLRDHFRRKDRTPKTKEELQANYQPAAVKTSNPAFDENYKKQFRSDSFLSDPSKGMYKTQLDGVSHLVEKGRGIAGHGMGTGKTILGVVAALHYKADKLAKGEKPKKTLVVAPKGIMSDWGKEIANHTNSKALYIGGGSSFKGSITKDGKKHWGQEGSEHETADIRKFKKGSHEGGDHDFHVVSYDTFMRNRDYFANSGLYDNIAIDEIHAFKNQGGQRGKSLAETTNRFQNVWGLSGTPMENDAREIHSLVDTVTGGKHALGTKKEFQDNYMLKDRNGKITGVKASKAEELGDILAGVIQFRAGEDVEYNDGTKIQFPHLAGAESKNPDEPSPKPDFIGAMVDRSRDHATNDYYGTKHSIVDYEEKEVKANRGGDEYTVKGFLPKNLSPSQKAMYDAYNQLQAKYLPESKLNELASAAATGYDQGKKGGENYLTAMQKLQKFINAPLAHKMYAPGGNAIESNETGVQSEKGAKKGGGLKPYDPKTGEGHYIVDKNGYKRYFESDGGTGFLKNPDGTPKVLPPLHHNNPKAEYLQKRVNTYLDALHQENQQRVKEGKTPIVPKLVVKSAYTTFGTDIIDNVLKDVRDTHPIFRDLKDNHGFDLSHGQFTGEATDREATKTGFRGNKKDYANNQGNLWATTVSPAGKEGVDFGNAHMMFHYDQDWNPQKMAQFTARVRRSDSWQSHAAMDRANVTRVESLHLPGTIEDFIFNAQDAKMQDIQQVVDNTKRMEENPKLGDTEGGIGFGSRGFTRREKKSKASKTTTAPRTTEKPRAGGADPLPKGAVAQADKALKLVVLL